MQRLRLPSPPAPLVGLESLGLNLSQRGTRLCDEQRVADGRLVARRPACADDEQVLGGITSRYGLNVPEVL